MAEAFKFAKNWSAKGHASFEALCFHRAEQVAEPYAALLRAPEIEIRATAEEILRRACEDSAAAIARAYETETESGARILASAIGKLCDAPGRMSSLVTVYKMEKFDMFERNLMEERGGVPDSYFGDAFGSGMVWDSFWHFEDPLGEDSAASFTTYHLTKLGLDYCLWHYPERVEELRKMEAARKC